MTKEQMQQIYLALGGGVLVSVVVLYLISNYSPLEREAEPLTFDEDLLEAIGQEASGSASPSGEIFDLTNL
jgi:hypothetical protein